MDEGVWVQGSVTPSHRQGDTDETKKDSGTTKIGSDVTYGGQLDSRGDQKAGCVAKESACEEGGHDSQVQTGIYGLERGSDWSAGKVGDDVGEVEKGQVGWSFSTRYLKSYWLSSRAL